MSAIKKFFQKRNLDVKFKKAGKGHKLDADDKQASSSSSHQQSREIPVSRHGLSEEARKASEAAQARVNTKHGQSSMSTMRERIRKEIEAEKKQQEALAQGNSINEGPKEVEIEKPSVLSSVLYTCPDIGPAVLPKDEMDVYIEEFLLSQLAEEPEMASALMIHTLNKDKEKVKMCVETLCKILTNIAENPTEEKFRKIRMSTKTFTEKIEPVKGSEEFLQAAGFQITSLTVDEKEDSYLVMNEHFSKDSERLLHLKEVLLTAEPIKARLDRGIRVFHPNARADKFEIPDEFYNVSPDELKKEQQRKQEAVEKLGMLRTKAMRERDELKELRKYKFTLLRVRLPNSIILQGTFRATEKMKAAYEFIRECLANDWIPFTLSTSGHKLVEDDSTLAENGLAPAALLNFAFDESIVKEVAAQQGSMSNKVLKDDLMALIQNL